jgi:hypothetical protein
MARAMAVKPMHEMPGYLPMQLRGQWPGVVIDWCFAGQDRLLASFFDESIQQFLERPFNRLFRPSTDISALEALVQHVPCAAPAGFIFHLSRCGSTLLAQMFAASIRTIVLSEAPPLDRILRAPIDVSSKQHWYQHMALALARKRDAMVQHSIIKCDSWHAKNIPLIERAFPGVPWIFLYRDPLEVLVSNLTLRSAQTLPGIGDNLPEGMTLAAALQMPDERYLAIKIACIMQDALAHANSPNALFINYRDLPFVAWPRILQHFALTPDAAESQQMLAKARFDAKQPSQIFTADNAKKQAQASALARECTEELLMPLYRQLEHHCWRPEP